MSTGRNTPFPESAPAGPWATAFYTVWGNAVLTVSTIVLGLLASVFGYLPPRGNHMFNLGKLWSYLMLWSAGTRWSAEYEKASDGESDGKLNEQESVIFMVNHQSFFDVPLLFVSLPMQTRFLAKRSLFYLPIFGWSLWAGGFVPVDRGNRAAAKRTIQAAIDCLQSGRSILIFPEETRSPDGRIRPFKTGGIRMALETGHRIVPVGIHGTCDARRKGSVLNRPARVHIRYGRPIDVRDADGELLEKVELQQEVRRRIVELSGHPRVEDVAEEPSQATA